MLPKSRDSYFIHLLSLTLLFILDSNDPVPKSKQTLRDHRELTLSAHVTVLPTVIIKSNVNIDMKKNDLQTLTESGVVIWFLKLPLKNK